VWFSWSPGAGFVQARGKHGRDSIVTVPVDLADVHSLETNWKRVEQEVRRRCLSLFLLLLVFDVVMASWVLCVQVVRPLGAEGAPGTQWYQESLFVHNAGALAPLSPLRQLDSLPDLTHAINLNVSSYVWLTSWFTALCRRHHCPAVAANLRRPATLVNVSSLAALEPFASMGVYSLGKAARDMATRVCAAEETELVRGVASLLTAPPLVV